MAKHVVEEARRCLLCKKPLCSQGCPVGTPVPEAIKLLLEGQTTRAGELLFVNNPLSVVCSLICPHEKFCEGHCVLGKKGMPIHVSSIEQYISDAWCDRPADALPARKGAKVAVIGSGPSGITVAFLMAGRGNDVTIFEAEEKIGGVLQYGIPEYRLPKAKLERLRRRLLDLGVKIRPNTLIGPVITLDDLFRDGYGAVFIGTGVWSPKPLRVKGETLGHVHYAINYLKNPDAFDLGQRVAIIGAGNVAMDVARTAVRKGSRQVTIYYRGSEETMSASRYEYEYAKVDGVNFEFHRTPVEIVDGGLRCQQTREETDPEGKVHVEQIPGSDAFIAADAVIIAVSQNPRSNIVSNTTGLGVDRYGLIITDEQGHTTRDGVFASGDVVTGARTVVEAVKYSKMACDSMEEWLAKGKDAS
jgi:glutamate synthase (NADPH/NADH) small chain